MCICLACCHVGAPWHPIWTEFSHLVPSIDRSGTRSTFSLNDKVVTENLQMNEYQLGCGKFMDLPQ